MTANRNDKLLELLQGAISEINKATQGIQALDVKVSNLDKQNEELRHDFNSKWNELPRLYVPRQEHQAQALDTRTLELEKFRLTATKEITEIRMTTAKQITDAVNSVEESLTTKIDEIRDDLFEKLDERSNASSTRKFTVFLSCLTVGLSLFLWLIENIVQVYIFHIK